MSSSQLFSKLDSVKISQSKAISETDQGFLEKVQLQYDELKAQLNENLNLFIELNKKDSNSVFSISENGTYVDQDLEADWHKKMMFTQLYSIIWIKKNLEKSKNTFIDLIGSYFSKTYNLDLFDLHRDFENYSNDINSQDVLAKILERLDGKCLIDKGFENIKQRLSSAIYCKENLSISGKKINLHNFVYLEEGYKGIRLSYRQEHLNALYDALQYFQNDSLSKQPFFYQYIPKDHESLNFFEGYGFPDYFKFSSLKFFKNRRLDINFRSEDLAQDFITTFDLGSLMTRRERLNS